MRWPISLRPRIASPYLNASGVKYSYCAVTCVTVRPVPGKLTGVIDGWKYSPPKLLAGSVSNTLGGMVNVPLAAGTEH